MSAALAIPDDPRAAVLTHELARCRAWLEPAIDHGADSSWPEVEAAVLAGTAQLWPGKASAAITEVGESPRGRWICAWLAGGDMAELVGSILPQAEAYGRSVGCTVGRLSGRKGWERALAAHGFKTKSVILWKDLA